MKQHKENISKIEAKLEEAIIAEDPTTATFADLMDHYKEITEIEKKLNERKFRISGDAIVAGAINILGIFLVINAEETRAITSKAFNLIKKG